jgi:diacylglycerol O-acyltransferase / wax synthase
VPPPDRLSALDAAFLDLETAEAPLHVGWTLRLDGPAPSVAALRRHIDARLDALPRFRRRIDGQQWADDPGFDVARHVHGMTLAAPGGPGELRALAGRLLGRPLDMDRPLWRLARIDGLAGGGWAIVGQAHHALVDGIAAVQVALLLFDGVEAEPSTWAPRPAPGAARVAQAGATRAARTVARALRSPSFPAREIRAATEALARPAAPTALNRSLTHRREVAFADAPLEEVRTAGRRHGATINDMLLAASSLAIGRALKRRGDRPQAVKALVPVNTRTGEPGDLGNDISFVTVDLPVRETDPLTTLRAVRDASKAAKARGEARPLRALAQAADLLPGPGRRLVTRAAARAAAFNVVVSNVPGPPEHLTLLGRRLTAMHPAVPFLHGHALSIGVLSYAGSLQAGVYADAEVLPDAVDVARDLEQALDALRIGRREQAPTPWRQRARARRSGAAQRAKR